MFIEENYSTFEELGIYELRQIARQYGVHSPSKFRKSELIEKINLIKKGELKPYFKKTKQGRPLKEFKTKEIVLDIPKKEIIENLLNAKCGVKSLIYVFNTLKIYHKQNFIFINDALKKIEEYINNQAKNFNFVEFDNIFDESFVNKEAEN